ncbi:protein aspartic protease in guard cell 1 [Phtheirospermum japonicum]|uniref:Protein aspartic protease in guard cell 1 n=1 Tax=Phtheirospermum japonicum TaxID=374723 RepID=A0A830BRB2_9LAMI|nr:protein aspartic protease in guard cell 1 [Phtheirospermum japonicum]
MELTSSISRALYLTSNTSSSLELTDIESQLTPGKLNGFLVHLRVGSKEVEQYVYMDTGSNLLWINCEPCGHKVPWPIFHPKESSSYQPEGCDFKDTCDASGAVHVDCEDANYDHDGCKYSVSYGPGGFSRGYLARETFKFGRINNETLRNIVFGCARRTNLYLNGILGLGNLRLSLISQYNASKFSYCIGNISDRTYAYNELVIGNQVQLWGSQTPLSVEDKNYINLIGIKIGWTTVKFNPKIFRRNSAEYTGGMVVDTGSTLSFIPQLVLTRFEESTSHLIESKLQLHRNYSIKYNNNIRRLCYGGVVTRDLKRFPIVIFHFQGHAYMELTADNIFQQIDDHTFCLAILPSKILKTTISILGNLMQQNFYVAYDLSRKKLSFKRMKCKTVEDYYDHDEL